METDQPGKCLVRSLCLCELLHFGNKLCVRDLTVLARCSHGNVSAQWQSCRISRSTSFKAAWGSLGQNRPGDSLVNTQIPRPCHRPNESDQEEGLGNRATGAPEGFLMQTEI